MGIDASEDGSTSGYFKFPATLYFPSTTPKIQRNQPPPPAMNDCNELDADVTSLASRLAALTTEHRDLDAVIAQVSIAPPPGDDLLLRRLKKRKLVLKDRISLIERLLDPDVPA